MVEPATRSPSELVASIGSIVVGRRREIELVVAALVADRHVVIEGPPGTGKSTLLRTVAHELGVGFEFVEGNAELTPARLVGHFDPARVMAEGYDADVFVDGPLASALRDGSLLYVEEINRVPEETLNVLITVMSEGELHVPRLGRLAAAPGFRLVAAMNPFDAIGTARISGAVYDRVCRLAVDYQTATDERQITLRESGSSDLDPDWVAKVVELVRLTRSHGDLRVGSSVRGAIDMCAVASSLAAVRSSSVTAGDVSLDAALVALSGRVRLREGTTRSTEDIVRELWTQVFGTRNDDGSTEGKGERPDRGDAGSLNTPPPAKEGDDADDEVSKARRKTTSRRALEQQPHFDEISPEVGELDEEAVSQALEDDPDDTLALLADLTGATDPKLRELARRLAGRLFLDLARRGPASPRGVGQLRTQRYRPDGGDLDVDASLDALVTARAEGSVVDPDDLRVRSWSTPGTAVCLLVDRSGSMTGRPLATAAVAASAVAWRSPDDYSVLSFGKDVVAAKSQDVAKSNEAVIDSVLALRGFGTTDVAGALTAAADQLSRSRAGRKITVLLSDCRATAPGDVPAAARRLDEVVVVAPESDDAEARALAERIGARFTTVAGPSDAAAALARVLDS
jgi:magnesium chelatase subunit D